MTAAKTSLPVLGVPVQSKALKGMDSLLSIAQMPSGIPVGTLAIGRAGVSATTNRQGSCLLRSKKRFSMKIGILGGGQLAQMMAIAGKKHGHELRKSYDNDSHRSKS